MTTRRRRLAAAFAVAALGSLFLATMLASPALAWDAHVTVSARCLEGQVRVHYIVESANKGDEGTVDVSYTLNGETTELPSGHLGPHHNRFSGHFDLEAGTTGTLTVTALAHWANGEETTSQGQAELPAAEECAAVVAPSTSPPTPSTEAPTPITEAEQVGGATSTTEGEALPSTGANSGPLLLAAVALVGGGFVILWASRLRGRHEAR
jgi:LPXTG-motif cell wall-anchored protein